MSLTNSATRYGAVAKTFHWIVALGILVAIPLGVMAHDAPYETADQLARKAWLFSLHKTVGVTVFFAAVLRILWAVTQPKPVNLHPERKLESFAAETVHWLLYAALIIVPLSGWIGHAASEGFAPIWWPFGQSLPFVPKSVALSETMHGLHVLFKNVLVVALLLHIAGALKHHVLDRDATLRRMLPGRVEAGTPGTAHGGVLPIVAAALVWVAAFGAGIATAEKDHNTGPALQAVASEWQVQNGALEVGISQFGSDVTGSFADWTAAITFDETATRGEVGDVTVTVNIASLTLGSVTDQALGTDYFDAAQFPTATYAGPILREGDTYRVDGTLSLRGAEIAAPLPFELQIADGTATASGALTLDRRAFGIGDVMTDPAQLGFEVTVSMRLEAQKGS